MLDQATATATRDGAAARMQRASGRVVVEFAERNGGTSLARLRQAGALKCFLPRMHGARPTAVLANTAGGIAGGDDFGVDIALGAGARAAATTQAAERIYRSLGAAARVRTRLRLDAGAEFAWTPDETILFDGARLDRRFDADLDDCARLLAVETLVFGRAAMGERVRDGALRDAWRVRRGGRLVFADAARIDAPIDDALSRPAVGVGARAVATLILAAPDAADRLDAARAALAPFEPALRAGASVRDGVLVARIVANAPARLRSAVADLRAALGAPPPPQFWRR